MTIAVDLGLKATKQTKHVNLPQLIEVYLTVFVCCIIFHAFFSFVDFFKIIFLKISFENTIRVSNILDPDRA